MSRGRRLIEFERGGATGVTVSAPAGWAQGPDGFLALSAANELRFEYDPADGSCKGALIEPAATNLLLQSRQLANVAWTKTRAVAASVDGADGMAASGSAISASAPLAVVYQAVSGLTPGQRYTFSAYVRGPQATLTSWTNNADGTWSSGVSAFGVPRRLFFDGERLEHRINGVDTGWPSGTLWRYDHSTKTVTIGTNPTGHAVSVDLACLVGAIGFYLGEGSYTGPGALRQRTTGRTLAGKSIGVPILYVGHADHPFAVGDEVWFSGGTWTDAAWAPIAEANRRQNPRPDTVRLPFAILADLRAHVRDGAGAPSAPPGYVVKIPEAIRYPLTIPDADGSDVDWLGGQWWRLPHLQTGSWHRVYVTRTAPASGVLNPAFFIQADYGSVGPHDFSAEMPAAFAAEGFAVDFCQLQAGEYPTSPIVTTTNSAIRAADRVTLDAPGGGTVDFTWGGLDPAAGPVSPLALADRRIAKRVQLRRGAGDAVEMVVTSSHGDFAAIDLTAVSAALPDSEYLTAAPDEYLTVVPDEYLVI
jgi:hypothetical protein